MGGIPLSEWSGSGATRELHETIKSFNEVTTRQTTWLLRLTWAITALTLVMTIAVLVQVYAIFYPPQTASTTLEPSFSAKETSR